MLPVGVCSKAKADKLVLWYLSSLTPASLSHMQLRDGFKVEKSKKNSPAKHICEVSILLPSPRREECHLVSQVSSGRSFLTQSHSVATEGLTQTVCCAGDQVELLSPC